ncbi:Biofilm growth-associated repressor [Serratia rubidaea]|uniref:ArsR/SmtB family transcription factor n=1 Tax=Serratia rubidaea TaxID=61652 RepID=UPI00092F3E79|nr:metalloregulator ArsR/SmtB family transcription factor [Serratia rubidaea]MDC6110809.1 metalloregulator ArsR/SmtB family transcription factor [Serratia rubidaea]CAI0799707.1 Biofilm growth-associated repressor [Serratia rubidaea]CAI1606107.1 Biofilm growth-associated repressor [Serratia rubidaea]HAY0636233.1 winged helix-turn-helix transcriptional regulator [Serratia rubidaea]HDJ2774795.1 winged helix-turn-helix transcriptional regulator [Serratia rubidaea]
MTPINQQQMRAAAARTAEILKSIANEDRLLLLCHLSQGEASVGEMETALGITQPTLSQQLGVLRRKQLVATRRAGKQIFYRIASPDVLVLLTTLYQLYCPAANEEEKHHDD